MVFRLELALFSVVLAVVAFACDDPNLNAAITDNMPMDDPMDGPGDALRDPLGLCPAAHSAFTADDASCWSTDTDCVQESRTCLADAEDYECPNTAPCRADAVCEPCVLAHCERCLAPDACRLCEFGYRRGDDGQCAEAPMAIECEDDEGEVIELNLRIHIMRDMDGWLHATGARLDNAHLTQEDVTDVILPEVNRIWRPARVRWVLESVIDEDIVQGPTYADDVAYVMAAGRDENGRSDPDRLPPLHRMMDDQFRTTVEQLEANANLFHLYLFPFIGNTGQGNAMRGFDFSTVTSTWSNKNKPAAPAGTYCAPQRRPLTEPWDTFRVGSVAQSIAHEVGHVLGLGHDDCAQPGGCLMKSNGYVFNPDQICTSRTLARARTPL